MRFLLEQNPQAVHLFESLVGVAAFGLLLGLVLPIANWLFLRRLSPQGRYICLLCAQLALGLSLPVALLVIPAPAELQATASTSPDSANTISAQISQTPRPVVAELPRDVEPNGSKPRVPKAGVHVSPAASPKTQAVARQPIDSFLSQLEASRVGRVAPLVSGGYAIVVLLLLARLIVAAHRGEWLSTNSEPIEDPFILSIISRQARRLGLSYVPAFAACEIAGPCVVGFIRPMLLLPLSLLADLSHDQIEMIVAHEIAHIRRYDPLLTLLQRLVEAFLFFHPVVWYLSRKIQFERECCCDDMVTNGGPAAESYAQVLADVARLMFDRIQIRRLTGPVPQWTLTGGPSQLRKRVARLLQGESLAKPLRNEPLRLARRSSLLVATMSLLLCVIVATAAIASPRRSLPLPSAVVLFRGMSPIHEAAAAGTRAQLAVALRTCSVDEPTRQGWSALEIATAVGREDILRDLLAARANPNFTDRQGRNALFAALGLGPTASLEVVPTARLNIIRLLLTQGVNVNCRDHNGMTPLDAAVVRDFANAASLLIEAGADINARDLHGRTPVIYACEGASPQSLQLLIASGANIHTKDDAGRDCFDAVSLQSEIRGPALVKMHACAPILIRAGLHPAICAATAMSMYDEVRSMLKSRSPELTSGDYTYRNNSPLIWAISRGDLSMVRLLLNAGASPDNNDALCCSVTHVFLDGDSILRALLAAHAQTNVRASTGDTPLKIAVDQLDVSTIKLLRSFGADPTFTDSTGRMPAEYIPDDAPPESRRQTLAALNDAVPATAAIQKP